MQEIKVRDAKIQDVQDIYSLINYYAGKGELLPREKEEIAENIRNFFVAEIEGKIVGCVSVKFYDEKLVEIRSLAVLEEYKGVGIGKSLIQYVISLLKELGVEKVFTLTRVPDFFKKFGFVEYPRNTVPQKIWQDCFKCPRLFNCDEILLIKNLGE